MADLEKFGATGKKLLEVTQYMMEIDDELSLVLQPIGHVITQINTEVLTGSYAESLAMLSAIGIEEIALPFKPITEDPPTTVIEEEAQEPSSEYFTDTGDGAIISPPMPHEVVGNGNHLAIHISELQSQAMLGSETKQRPRHYPHENVVFHVAQLRTEALREQQPDRLMTVQEVVDSLQLPQSTVWTWLATGRLKERGRVWLAEPGGRGSPLVSQAQAEFLKNNRPPMGRPPKRKA